ncbi:hypothetical protein BK010_08630 [Tenericutes bacterium MO-XQ]|nr:hypothetical protein BK010_08120 [Tenericutes bacterium MO-XQ]AUD63652.1 hypothetical protein BK010_08630 [Tenericutes bacterium MO-XQ]
MLDKKLNKLSLLTILVGTILLFDIGTIISNIYISPILEGYGLPDIFIYLKTVIFFVIFVILMLWQNNKSFNLTKTTVRILIFLGFFTIVAYFFSLFMYKYVLIFDTAEIIRNNILYGNPNLVFDFSAQNYKTLSYVTTIFGGFNSEAILFAEALVFEIFLFKSKTYEVKEEKKHEYDLFLFDPTISILFIVLAIVSFVSINIFTFRYDELASLEMGISILGFMIVASGISPSAQLIKGRGEPVTKSFFRGNYNLLFVLLILSTIIFAGLFSINVVFISLNRSSYRLVTSLIALIISIVLAVKVYIKLRLDNK